MTLRLGPAASDTAEAVPPPNRAQGVLEASFRRVGRRTGIDRIHEAGGLRLRFPNVARGFHPDCEAVCINTGGGMVGGDTARLGFAIGPGAAATLTTQSAEKIYRAEGTPTRIAVTLDLGAGASAEWLPQEAILYDRVGLERRLDVALAADASLLMVESLVFGRIAMGETVRTGSLHDRWHVRREGKMIFAEDLRMQGPIADLLDRPAVGAGARAVATLLFVAPDAEARLESVRAALAQTPAESGASAWNGMLSVRALSPSPDRLKATIVAVLQVLRGRAAPRVWQ